MRRCQHMVVVVVALLCLVISDSQSDSRDDLLLDALVYNLLHAEPYVQAEALKAIEQLGNPAAIPALIELLRFDLVFGASPLSVLEQLAGETPGDDWPEWVEWLQKHSEIRPNRQFLAWKSFLFSRLDPAFKAFLYPGASHRIRVEEIVWGGVRKDGIPALTNPKYVQPDAATYLTPEELVFGVSINGDPRAYPLRILDWHEMFNDVVGGKPVTLAY